MKPTSKTAFEITSGVIDAILCKAGWLIVALSIVSWVSNKWWPHTDASDKDQWTRSGMRLLIDYGTGRHYLYKDGVMIPRLDADGNLVTEPTHP